MQSMLRAAPGPVAFPAPARTLATALLALSLLAACAPQNVREDDPAPGPEAGAELARILEPGPPPPDLAPPSDEVILERLRERAAARRAALARLKLDEGDARYPDIWARLRAGFTLPRPQHPSVTSELNWYVRQPAYLQRTTDRARLYLAHIVHEAERRNLPLELALLPVVESAFQPYARSPAGAMGIWQFIRSTGRRFGLNQSAWYDGRRDILESTRAAFDYLQRLHQDLDGDWLLAVAAYNAGEGNVLRARRRNRAAGKPEDFFSLSLPAETRAYVPRLLAVVELVRDPDAHDIVLDPIDDEPYFERVDVGAQIDLGRAAEMAGISLNEMMLLNPGFFRHATDPAGPHHLLLPKDSVTAFTTALAATAPEELTRWETHTVSRGDTLSAIADHYGVSVRDLTSANDMDSTRLQIGQQLKVPGATPAHLSATLSPEVRRGMERARRNEQRRVYRVRSGDNLWTIARRNKVSLTKLMRWNGLGRRSVLRPGQRIVIWSASAAPSAPRRRPAHDGGRSEAGVHVVRSGESLWHIARRYRLSSDDLARWNDIGPSAILHPGQKLRLAPPRSAASGPTPLRS